GRALFRAPPSLTRHPRLAANALGRAEQPARQRFRSADRFRPPSQSEKGGLKGILRCVFVAEPPPADAQNHWPMPFDQGTERIIGAAVDVRTEQSRIGRGRRDLPANVAQDGLGGGHGGSLDTEGHCTRLEPAENENARGTGICPVSSTASYSYAGSYSLFRRGCAHVHVQSVYQSLRAAPRLQAA